MIWDLFNMMMHSVFCHCGTKKVLTQTGTDHNDKIRHVCGTILKIYDGWPDTEHRLGEWHVAGKL